jgi:hypothetical protein
MLARSAARVALVLASFGLVLAVGEAVLRSEPKRNDVVMRAGGLKYRFNPYQRDALVGYSLRPDWETVHASGDFQVPVRTNALGMRGAPVSSLPSAGSLRILFAGDSYPFGFGVEEGESFPVRTGQLLGAALGRPVEVINAGVPGWAMDQTLLSLREHRLDLQPDLLVVSVMQNDIVDLGWHRLEVDDQGLPTRVESRRHTVDQHGVLRWLDGDAALVEVPVPQSRWLAERSQLYHWVRSRLVRLWLRTVQPEPSRPTGEASSRTVSPLAGLSEEEIQQAIEASPDFRVRYHEALLAAIERDARARGIAVRFVTIGHAGPDYDAVRSWCEARSGACFDTQPLFAGNAAGALVFPSDGHWNAAGHERAARAISEWLTADPLLAMRRAEAVPGADAASSAALAR